MTTLGWHKWLRNHKDFRWACAKRDQPLTKGNKTDSDKGEQTESVCRKDGYEWKLTTHLQQSAGSGHPPPWSLQCDILSHICILKRCPLKNRQQETCINLRSPYLVQALKQCMLSTIDNTFVFPCSGQWNLLLLLWRNGPSCKDNFYISAQLQLQKREKFLISENACHNNIKDMINS